MSDDNDIKKSPRAALYCRVSTEDQAKEGFSLSAQRERLEAYCKAKGWEIAKVYVDDGYSGRSDNRPGYRELMDDKDEWNVLVVMKMDRIHRNSKNFTMMMERLREWEKEFTSMQESFDTTTAMGRFVMDIIQRIAQLESEQIGERVYVGMRQKAKMGEGILGFKIPYGYDKRGGSLIRNLKEADEVRLMFEQYAGGYSLRSIGASLMERNIPTKHGYYNWDPKTIYRILSNPVYCGYHRWEEIIYPGDIDRVVEVELYNDVQRKLHKNPDDYIIDLSRMDPTEPVNKEEMIA